MNRMEKLPVPSAVCFLNVGCGRRFSRDVRWLNVDLAPASPEVTRIDAQHGLPFADATFRAVYHSHVLEHLHPDDARGLLRECHRILKPGGVLRVVVPNLEEIARCYLARLEEARADAPGAEARYQWAVAEICDQMVRRVSGGEMIQLLRTGDSALREYATKRCGAEVAGIIRELDAETTTTVPAKSPVFSMRHVARALRERMRRFVLGRDFEMLGRARFAESGEVHRWMYDDFSLGRKLGEAGFVECRRREAATSEIADWASFGIDADATGAPLKPDSLFMEALKLANAAA